jgi:hypothetical protein
MLPFGSTIGHVHNRYVLSTRHLSYERKSVTLIHSTKNNIQRHGFWRSGTAPGSIPRAQRGCQRQYTDIQHFWCMLKMLICMRRDMATPITHPVCPRNGKVGQPVPRQTLQSLALLDLYDLSATDYWFCDDPNCSIVYFDAEGMTVSADQIRVPIWQKQPDDPTVPVCYCRKITSKMIRDEVARTGQSAASAQVTAIVKAKRCACDLTNPQGTCCLGNVRRVIRNAKKG